ncbi:MAG: DUF177 domain-containing protein [Emcibacteraceae bacterium]|nr:DUF177 domain-containing protein [Emcibacteraceae bacterium]MDG1995042.1 DUF177 domain-containing protein [Emcibacteraceae bacterium]
MSVVDIINELSRPYNLEKVLKAGTELKVVANNQECVKLSERFSIPKVVSLNADCVIKKLAQKHKGDFLLNVKMEAEVIQQCVLSLNDVPESIDEEFSIIFQIISESGDDKTDEREVEFNMEDDDVEIISGFDIDVGEYIAEYLALSIRPYPRLSKVSQQEIGHKIMSEENVNVEPEKKNPFAVLKDLKHKT